MGCVVTTVLAGAFNYFGDLPVLDMVWIWVYDLICLAIIDVLKVCYLRFMGVNMDVLPDEDTSEPPVPSRASTSMRSRTPSKSQKAGGSRGMVDALIAAHDDEDMDLNPRASASMQKLHNWAESKSGRTPSQYSFQNTGGEVASLSFRGSSMRAYRNRANSDAPSGNAVSVVPSAQSFNAANVIMGRSLISAAGSLRPNTPAHAARSFSHRR
jgi:hypothetical protein